MTAIDCRIYIAADDPNRQAEAEEALRKILGEAGIADTFLGHPLPALLMLVGVLAPSGFAQEVDALTVPCPYCLSTPGTPCVTQYRAISSAHQARRVMGCDPEVKAKIAKREARRKEREEHQRLMDERRDLERQRREARERRLEIAIPLMLESRPHLGELPMRMLRAYVDCIDVPCLYCNEAPGELCKSSSGVATQPHAARVNHAQRWCRECGTGYVTSDGSCSQERGGTPHQT